VARQYKMRAESDAERRKAKPKPQVAPTSAAPDRKALEWQKRNEWFGSTSTKDRIMTQAAMVIHKELIDESISTSTKDRIMTQAAMVIHKELIDESILPNNSPEEYYSELDSRIRDEFPDRFKNTRIKKIPTVISGTRSAIGKNQVKLTKTEVDMANRLGVSLQDYARQKVRQQAGG